MENAAGSPGLILVTGATGFVGRHLVAHLRKQGAPVRCLVRTPGKAGALAELGAEVVPGDILAPDTLEKAAAGVQRVVHLVGIIQERGTATFDAIHVEGTRNLLEACRGKGIRCFLYQSALGTRPDARSRYHQTKWQAEELVRASGLPYTISRPSLIYGRGDDFTTRLVRALRMAPVALVPGPGTAKLQPLFIEDLVRCLHRMLVDPGFLGETVEMGGPEQLTLDRVIQAIARAVKRPRPLCHLPVGLLRPAAAIMEALLPTPPLTRDQLVMLQEDNVCAVDSVARRFGFDPVGFEQGLARIFP